MKTKIILLASALSVISFLGNAQVITHTHDWTRYNGDDGYESGVGIVTSDDGYVYSTGVFEQSVNFGSPSAPATVNSNGIRDVYICKRDANGQIQWARSFGGSSSESVVAIDIDNESNIYITGSFYGTVDFNPSPFFSYNMTQSGSIFMDVYISKFDENGNFIWAKQLKGTNTLESTDLTVSTNYNDIRVHVTGSFSDQVDVNPSPSIFGVQLLNSAGSGDQDGFCVTLDQNGNYTKSYHLKGSSSDVSITSVAIDPYLTQYFTGTFEGTCDFDTDTPVENMTSTGLGPDAFIMRVGHYSGFGWVRQLKCSVGAYPTSIKVTQNLKIYTIGNFSGDLNLEPHEGGYPDMHTTSNMKTSVYISKLDYNGFYAYGKSISGTGPMSTKGNVYGKDLHVTSGGKAYFTGYFNKTVDFNPGTGVKNITALGAEDAYICGLNTYGNLWSMNTSESMYSWGEVRNNAIDLNSSEDIYTTGRFTELVNFNPPGYAYFGISSGGYDEFVHKLERIQLPFGNSFPKSNIEANNTSQFEIGVFPNPTSDVLNLNLPGEESAHVLMYSTRGQLVYSGKHNAGRSSISMDNLAEGVYILKITQGEKTENVRVVKK